MNQIKKRIEKMGVFLVRILRMDQPGRGKSELWQELILLKLGDRDAVQNYYVRKVLTVLAVLLAGGILSVLCGILFSMNGSNTAFQSLQRPGYGEGSRMESLNVLVDGEEEARNIEVTVRERTYTDQEKKERIDRALEALDQIVAGENDSMDEVRTDLVLPDSMEDGAVSIRWLSMPYGVIDEDGTLIGADSEAGTLVELQGTISCGGEEAVYTIYANVFPPVLEEEEQLQKTIEKEVELADIRDSTKEELSLPEEIEGKKLTWTREQENLLPAVLVLTILIAVCIFLRMDNQVHEKAEARRGQLMLDYPDLMWKLTMLLGAGISIKSAFTRISGEYLRAKEAGQKHCSGKTCLLKRNSGKKQRVRFVYEEVTAACYEMQSGISEAQAYERFGKRCQLSEYIRLGTVLSQNLKKGSSGLVQLLTMEADASLTERKNHARKIGEQAGTKLLLPMIVMLGIVLVILMVPAFLSF